jgi:hypothetical protein
LTHVAPDLPEQFAKSSTKPFILKLASQSFPINPCLDTNRRPLNTPRRAFFQRQAHRAPRVRIKVLNNESQQILPIQLSAFEAPLKSIVKLWVIERS